MPTGPRFNALVFVALVAVAVASRLVPHAPNAAGVAAVALFAGFFFRNRLLALGAPLTAMLLSDAFIGGYQPGVMVAVYLSFLAPVFAGRWIGSTTRGLPLLARAAAFTLAGSILFFITTNLAVWMFAGYYPPTLTGLAACFTAALPFFRFTLTGDMTFTLFLFGGYAAIPAAVGIIRSASRAANAAVVAR